MDRPEPFFIFDRDGTDHPWERPLRELKTRDDKSWHAVAENWQMDHRVSRERETKDLLGCGCFTAGCGADEWRTSLRLYHEQHICLPSDPAREPRSAYMGAWNESNYIRGVAPSNRLCHVGSLRNIVGRVLKGKSVTDAAARLRKRTGVVLPEKGPGEMGLAKVVKKFAKDLTERGEVAIRRAAGILLEALGPNEPPWWACFAGDLKHVETWSAIRLCQALGLGHLESPDWLIVWMYETADAGRLYRPTVVEAYDCPYHYPSPPGVQFGMTMPLDPKFEYCWEVVHRPLRGTIAETACTGKLLPLENFPSMKHTQLMKLRGLHRARLRAWHDRHSGS